MPIGNGRVISVELATDAQFQSWVASQGIPIDEQGIIEWSFDDRCGVINHVLSHGLSLQFAEGSEAAQEGA